MGVAVSAYARSQKLRGLMNQLGLAECTSLTRAEEIEAGVAAATVVPMDTLKGLAAAASNACIEFLGLVQSARAK
jgi:hypothetical protein